jgi:hypothetical protein
LWQPSISVFKALEIDRLRFGLAPVYSYAASEDIAALEKKAARRDAALLQADSLAAFRNTVEPCAAGSACVSSTHDNPQLRLIG